MFVYSFNLMMFTSYIYMRDGQCVTQQASSFRVVCRCNQGVSLRGRDELIKMDQSEEATPAELITAHPCLIPVPGILVPHRLTSRAIQLHCSPGGMDGVFHLSSDDGGEAL